MVGVVTDVAPLTVGREDLEAGDGLRVWKLFEPMSEREYMTEAKKTKDSHRKVTEPLSEQQVKSCNMKEKDLLTSLYAQKPTNVSFFHDLLPLAGLKDMTS